jgi:hypothetical protein
LLLAALLLLPLAAKHQEKVCAQETIAQLQYHRDLALQSNVPEAASVLRGVAEGENMKQTPGSSLDRMCTLQRSNVIAQIIAYLRTKTGDDLGDKPGPWVHKYAE